MKVVVIGGGPAGMMASISAAKSGNEVLLLERNDKLGKKLFISGKGRCNVTNNRDISDFFNYITTNKEFLYSSLYSFTNLDTKEFIESNGVKLKVEQGMRVFPESNKSSDIIKVFQKELVNKGVSLKLNSRVLSINKDNRILKYVSLDTGENIYGDYFIFATGGASYPLTGSDGSIFKELKKIGHSIVRLKPHLVPIEIKETFVKDLQGLSIKNASLKLYKNEDLLCQFDGDFLFTHFGISGPIALKLSKYIEDLDKYDYKICIDFKKALSDKDLYLRIQKDFLNYKNKDFKNALKDLVPLKMEKVIIDLSGIDESKKVNSITKLERNKIIDILKNMTISVKSLRPLQEAIVTSGGIDTREVSSSTMKSKILDNVSFCGEVLDVDAFTGGYNVQIAISTGFLAGNKLSI